MRKTSVVSFLILAPSLLGCLLSATRPFPFPKNDVARLPFDYGIDFWREGEGLSQRRIRCIVQTRDGYLWLATDNGLVRFNGRSFTAYTTRTKSLPDNEVRALKEDNEGGLWIGTVRGLTLLKDGHFRTFGGRQGLPPLFITKLDRDPEGNIWMSTDGGAACYSHGKFTSFTAKDGVAQNFVRSVAAGTAGVFVANPTMLYRYENGRFVAIDGLVRPGDGRINDLLCTREGSLWVSFENGIIKRLKQNVLVAYGVKGEVGAGATCLYEDPGGTLWLASPRGVLRLDGDDFRAITPVGVRQLGVVYSLCADREGSLWIGMESDGLARFRVNKLRTLAAEDGLANDSTQSVFEDSRGTIWIGTATGFAGLSQGEVSNYTTVDGVPIGPVRSLAEDADGRVWIGAGHSVLTMKDGRLTRFPGWPGTVEIRVICRDARDRMWVGTDGDGLFCVEDGRVTRLTVQDGLPSGQIRAVHLDRRGGLWIATAGGGVARYADGRVKKYGPAEGLAGDRVLDILEDDEGSLWFATRGGLTRFKNKSFFSYTADDGLPETLVYAILDDSLGNFWFTGASGIFKVNKADLRDFADGRVKTVRSTAYGEMDGMRSRACAVGNWPSAWRTADGGLLFCTMKGIVMVDPDHLSFNPLAPPVFIERVTINRKAQSVGSEASLPAGSGEVEIHYAALSYLAPQKVRFRYMLEGFSHEWIEAEARTFAYYTNLPPGNYHFRVTACNNDGVWNRTPAVYRFVLQPRFHQTRLFWALAVAVLGLVGWGAYQVRLLELKKRYSAVLDERNRIACEIHDTLAQNLAGIALQLDSVTMQSVDIPNELRRHLDQACDLTRYSLAGARDAVMDLRERDLERRELWVVLSEIGRKLSEGAGPRISVDIVGNPRRLDPITEKNLVRIFQEAVCNAVKHSEASAINVELRYDASSIALRVQDDGCGFDSSVSAPLCTGHYGVIGMRERAQRIGGFLTLTSQPGLGTTVVVEVPSPN
jgi:ligand-binding sensor domain-containing protein/signal transduction histidine kinase